MSVLLEIFGKQGYAQYRLPDRKNTDFSLWLDKEVFRIRNPLRIVLVNIDCVWFIRASDLLFCEAAANGRKRLLAGDCFDMIAADGDLYTFTVYQIASQIRSYGKYSMRDTITIGRDEANDIVIHNKKMVSREHARIIRRDQELCIESKSINGMYINGKFSGDIHTIRFGDRINIMGLHLILLQDHLAVQTEILDVHIKLPRVSDSRKIPPRPVYTRDSNREYAFTIVHRAPRSFSEIDRSPIDIDPPPEPQEQEQASILMSFMSNILMTMPLVVGSLFLIYASAREGETLQIYMYGGLLMALMSLLSGVSLVIIQDAYSRKRDKILWQQHKKSYKEYLIGKERDIQYKKEETSRILNERYINSESCLDIKKYGESLWSCLPVHKDFYECRVGTGNMELAAKISVPSVHFSVKQNELMEYLKELGSRYQVLKEVPFTISLKKYSQIGLISESESVRMSLVRMMAVQMSFSHCYTDTKIGLIYDEADRITKDVWRFMRWMPHVWSEDQTYRMIASDMESARRLLFHLLSIIKEREDSECEHLPLYIIFVAASHFLEGEPIERYLNKDIARYGIVMIWMAPERELLPHSCRLILEKTDTFQGITDLLTGKRQQVRFDLLTEDMVEDYSRKMSVLRVNERSKSSEIPREVTFFQMIGIHSAEEVDIVFNWKKNRPLDSLRVPVGLKAGGRREYLDVHEKYHGPHGLIAGTTGSGKSELLQTYILSLMLIYGPEAVNFFLIDYKGGGMAGMFEGIPHICGQISNLSGNMISRAMTSLRSENLRRQRLFQKYKVNNINDYLKLYYSSDHMESLPHLLIIIDEFAELKREEPEFMQELISISQVGRSLGLHLILATQKPGGTVDDAVWSNARFRLCLKVQEKQDSMDMLHKADAADIQTTGQCFFQVGNDEIYELFQTGWSGALCRDLPEHMHYAGRIRLSGEKEVLLEDEECEAVKTEEKTQFEVIREHIMSAAAGGKWTDVRRLWMDPLPKKIYLDDLSEPENTSDCSKAEDSSVMIGMADDPANQRQFPVYLDLKRHTVVCGLPMSGKSTFFQTVLYSIMKHYDAVHMHVYVIDFSNAALKCFEEMPQAGGIVTAGEDKKCRTLLFMLQQILDNRKQKLAGSNYFQYCRNNKKTMARIVVIIDNYSSFYKKAGDLCNDIFLRLCKEGENAGITLMVSCGGFSADDLPLQTSDYFKEVFCLELKERFSYVEVMGSLDLSVLPEKGIPGRGICRFDGRILEFQTALAAGTADDYERMQRIHSQASDQKREYQGELPQRLRYIPEKPEVDDFLKSRETIKIIKEKRELPLGFLEQTAEIASFSWDVCRGFLISGQKKSGKHNCFRMLVEALKLYARVDSEPSSELCIIDFSGRLSQYKNDSEISRYLEDPGEVYRYLTERMQISLQPGTQYPRRSCILIENLRDFVEETGEIEQGPGDIIKNSSDSATAANLLFAAIVRGEDYDLLEDDRCVRMFGEQRFGVWLGGCLMDDMIFDHSSLSYEEQMAMCKPGTGYLFPEPDIPEKIVVPIVGEA